MVEYLSIEYYPFGLVKNIAVYRNHWNNYNYCYYDVYYKPNGKPVIRVSN